MSHPAIVTDDQNQPNEPLETPPSSPDLAPESPPNPSNPPVGNTEVENTQRYNQLLEETLRANNVTIQQLQDQLAIRQTAPSTPASPGRTEEEERQDFYNRPMAATRELIREELDRTIAPLTEFVRSFQGGSAAEKLVARFKVDPRFSGMWDTAVEQAVNSVLSRLAPEQINEQTVQSTVIQAIGLKAIGQLAPISNNGTPAASTPPSSTPSAGNPPVPVTPPHMRPSAPPGPSNNPRAARRQLNENEKRLAREKRMTDDQYLDWIEMPASQIGKAPIPGAAPKAGK